MNNRKGFTLVETLVVLVISALILSLSLWIAHNFNGDQYRNDMFWKEFKVKFESYENLARDHHESVTILFNASRQRVYFTSTSSKVHQSVIQEPRDLSNEKTHRVQINNDGHVDPSTVVWMINGQPKLAQRFQLGWGMYTVENIK